ncbi:hypothetical protein [Actinoallomurus sp. CA-150999]|uniref:hypothetical protein n=1 Tax=Actinoallomurus sp. CA-150999 TaxID=3239887 RepID=UPI003D8E2134
MWNASDTGAGTPGLGLPGATLGSRAAGRGQAGANLGGTGAGGRRIDDPARVLGQHLLHRWRVRRLPESQSRRGTAVGGGEHE